MKLDRAPDICYKLAEWRVRVPKLKIVRAEYPKSLRRRLGILSSLRTETRHSCMYLSLKNIILRN